MHHLRKYEQVLEIVRYLLGDELHEVGHQLVEARICPYTGQCCKPVFIAVVVKERVANFLEIKEKLFGQDVLHQWLDGHVVTIDR